jgi:hypothetical protein
MATPKVLSKLHTLFTAGIAEYTGKEVKEIKVHSDPKVAGTYAIRASFTEGNDTDFLIVGNCIEGSIGRATPEVIAENLEEIECKTWPPVSGNPRFFV